MQSSGVTFKVISMIIPKLLRKDMKHLLRVGHLIKLKEKLVVLYIGQVLMTLKIFSCDTCQE